MDHGMEKIEVQRDGDSDIRFTGIQRASVSSWRHDNNIRWTELAIYITSSGRYVCTEVGRTCWQGETDRYAAFVCDTEADVVEALGYGRLAKELYEDAGIDHAQEID